MHCFRFLGTIIFKQFYIILRNNFITPSLLKIYVKIYSENLKIANDGIFVGGNGILFTMPK